VLTLADNNEHGEHSEHSEHAEQHGIRCRAVAARC